MGGDGGMVAVVQGLRDAGLAVTMLSHRNGQSGRTVVAKLVGVTSPIEVCHVDTATDTTDKDYAKSVLYRSSYQTAHCQPLEYSPVRLQKYSPQECHQLRSRTVKSRDEVAFVESLRKYPFSPVRSRSADLIERMLWYTQSKNKPSYTNTESAKSLPSKAPKDLHADEIPTRDTGLSTNDLKPNFGFKRDVELIPVPTSNRKSRCETQMGMYDYLKSHHKDKKLKQSEVRYLTNVKQCLREKLRQLCDEDTQTVCPKIQNRFRQHIKEYHKPETSQKTHKVNHCKKPEKCPDCKDEMTQASSQDETLNNNSPNGSSTSRERKASRVERSLSSFKYSKACYCNQPGQPGILKPIMSSPEYHTSDYNKRKQCIPICEYECNETNDSYIGQLREIIFDWFNELPVYSNFTTKDAIKREEVINRLIDTLKQVQKDNMYLEKVENEIKKSIKQLPMWHPVNKTDYESFENQLVYSLVQRIKGLISKKNVLKDEISKWVNSIRFTDSNIDKEKVVNELTAKLKSITLKRPPSDKEYKVALKSEIGDILRGLPIEVNGSKTMAIDGIADRLIEKLDSLTSEQSLLPTQPEIKNVILDWLKGIPQISDHINVSNGDDVLVNDLITRLNNLQNQNVDIRQQRMNQEITNWLSSIEKQKKLQIDREAKNMLVNELVNKLENTTNSLQSIENLNEVLQKWFDDMPDSLGVSFIDNQEDLKMLAMTLQKLQTSENDENQQNTIRQEIFRWLQNMQRKSGRYVDDGTQEILVNKLMNMITNDSKMQKQIENGLIIQKIWEWLESQPEFKQDNSLQYRDMVAQLSEKLQYIKDQKGDLTDNDVKTEVTNWFQKLSQERGIKIETINQKKLQDKLISSINPKKSSKWDESNNIPKLISKEVSNIIDDSIIQLNQKDKERLKDQITEVVTQDWNAFHEKPSDVTISKVKNIVKQATNLPDPQIARLADSLITKINENLELIYDGKNKIGPLILKNASKSEMKSKVADILSILPLKEQSQVIETITDALIKNYEDGKTTSGFDVIYEVLKKANVNEVEARDMTNKILGMSSQFRDEVTDSTYKYPSYGSGESLWMQKQMFMQRLEREITEFMEKVLNESSSFYKEKTSSDHITSEPLEDSMAQYDRFKNIPFKTSTPTKSDSGWDVNISNRYKNQLKDIIKKWMTSLDKDSTVEEPFKNDMANDIATDFVDRQRYIQHSNRKRSSLDELEHLKYQIFKWTNKLPNLSNLITKTSEIKMLIKSLERIEIPNLIQKTRKAQNIADGKVHNASLIKPDLDITQDTEYIEENLDEAIWSWLNELPILKPRGSEDRHIMEDLVAELSKKIKNMLNLKTNMHVSNIGDLCKDQIVHSLRKVTGLQNNTEEELKHIASELMNYLKSLDFFSNLLEQNQEILKDTANIDRKKNAIKQAVQSWSQKLPLKNGQTYNDIKDIVDNLAEAISRYLLVTNIEDLNKFMDDILNILKKMPIQIDGEESKNLPKFTERLIEKLKNVLSDEQIYYNDTKDDFKVEKPTFKKAFDIMYDNIQNWCEKLPLDSIMSSEGIDQVNMIKNNLAGKLLRKIGELNLDPDIFNDDYFYEILLKDEIQKILDGLPKNNQLREILPTLKETLVKDLLSAKEKMKNEIAGFAYKQHLRHAISNTLSSIGLLTPEETSFEVLKDNLVDAFISLHYASEDQELKRKFKDKIFNEVNKFCEDYLKRNPLTPLNAHELNQELYKALKKVPTPKDESIRREVEYIRVKDIITDWFKDLSLEEMPSQVQKIKIISILAKRLNDIENEAEFNPDMYIDDVMNDEILKWLKKLKLKSETESNLESITTNLINKLKNTKYSRKLGHSTIRKSIDYTDLPNYIQDTSTYPPTNLSIDDQAHLQRIKERTSTKQALRRLDIRKNASVSSVPIVTSTQTDERPASDNLIFKVSQNASIQTINREPELPAAITPQVIVKEYYWDSRGSPAMQRSGSILSGTQLPYIGENTQQQTNANSHEITSITRASQTIPIPVSKATTTQESSTGPEINTRTQNDIVGTSSQTPSLAKEITTGQQNSNDINSTRPQVGQYGPDDYLQINCRNRREIKSCQPCRERREFDGSAEAGPCRYFQKTHLGQRSVGRDTNKRTDFQKSLPEFYSENENCLDYPDHIQPPRFRRPIYQTPTKDVECLARCKRRNQQSCTYRTPMLKKCTIRPLTPCHQSNYSNKSCYVSKNHCPKCWDGFCPYPSYLYFRPD